MACAQCRFGKEYEVEAVRLVATSGCTLRVPTKPAGYSRFFVILGASVRRAAKTA